MRMLINLALLLLLSGCVTGYRSFYEPISDEGGYFHKEIGENRYVSTFSGNGYTAKQDAQVFAHIRAIEICTEKGFKVAEFLGSKDRTSSKTVQKSSGSSYQAPTTFNTSSYSTGSVYGSGNTLYGQSNTNTSGNIFGGSTISNNQTWNETYHFPYIEVLFSCENKIRKIGIELRPVDEKLTASFVKDGLGAMQVIKVSDQSPNYGKIKVGDIILKISDERVFNLDGIGRLTQKSSKDSLELEIVREGKKIKKQMKLYDVTQYAFDHNRKIVAMACSVEEIAERPICNTSSNINQN